MNSEKSYDSLPNFTAADCEFFLFSFSFSFAQSSPSHWSHCVEMYRRSSLLQSGGSVYLKRSGIFSFSPEKSHILKKMTDLTVRGSSGCIISFNACVVYLTNKIPKNVVKMAEVSRFHHFAAGKKIIKMGLK